MALVPYSGRTEDIVPALREAEDFSEFAIAVVDEGSGNPPIDETHDGAFLREDSIASVRRSRALGKSDPLCRFIWETIRGIPFSCATCYIDSEEE